MFFKNIEAFSSDTAPLDVDKSGQPTRYDFQLAISVLLLAMAHQDKEYVREEFEEIQENLSNRFNLSRKECDRLLETAECLRRNATKLDFFLRTIDFHFSLEQKQTILGMIWLVAEADGVIQDVEAQLAADIRVRLGLTLEQALYAREIAAIELL